jgi:hypothetical protein
MAETLSDLFDRYHDTWFEACAHDPDLLTISFFRTSFPGSKLMATGLVQAGDPIEIWELGPPIIRLPNLRGHVPIYPSAGDPYYSPLSFWTSRRRDTCHPPPIN